MSKQVEVEGKNNCMQSIGEIRHAICMSVCLMPLTPEQATFHQVRDNPRQGLRVNWAKAKAMAQGHREG